MTKKSFKGGLNTLLGEASPIQDSQMDADELITIAEAENETEAGNVPVRRLKEKRGKAKTSTRVITKTSQENCRDNETRATFIVREDYLAKVKAIAFWTRKPIKDVVNIALEMCIKAYELENGEVPVQEQQQ